ncbi:uncharacterized protein [Henckelia pumila]|uniref:uncharacterized protein n=1 Tax=Henckelia pumila TaxID=405737 RepID=UPI003C6E7E48
MATQVLIRQCAKLRIGSGLRTRIWDDPWLPNTDNPYIESEGPSELRMATVSSLRLYENGGWNIPLIRNLFNVRDQLLILSIPLSRHARVDRWIWGDDKRGCYTVKSGYMYLLKLHNQIPPVVGINWSHIWNLNVPGKIQNFIWRSLSNVLPTMKSLRHRRIEIPEWCPLCRHEEEDGLHALVSCSLVRNIWHLTSIGSYIGSAISITDWWHNLTTTRDSSDIEMAAILMWNIRQN